MMRKIGLYFLLVIASLEMGTIVRGEDTTPVDPAVAAANTKKAVADAEKAAADAQTAQAQAELAALKAKIGEVPTSSQTGAVDLKDKAGYLEASLLASRAIVDVTAKIVNRLPENKGKTILLASTSEVPNFSALMTYKAQIAILKKAKEIADYATNNAKQYKIPEKEEKADNKKTKALPLVAIAGAGLVLDAGSKLLNFFKTDFTVGGIQITLEDSIVIHALAGPLVESKKFENVLISNLINPTRLSESMVTTLEERENDRIQAQKNKEIEAEAVKYYTDKVSKAEKLKTEAENALKKSKLAKKDSFKKKYRYCN